MNNRIFAGVLSVAFVLGPLPAASAAAVPGARELVSAQGDIDWSRYYNSDEILQIMKALEGKYPNLARVYVIGKSYLGRDLHLMEVTNREIKTADEKPAVYIDGNMHTGEQTGAMLALYMIHHLLTRYGVDERVTRLLDTRTFYLRPKYEVDASDWWLANPGDTDYGGSVHPRDNDLDGEADEDPTDDLNGDGYVTRMRIEDPKGEWKISDKDPRAMVKRQEHELEGTFYRLLSEGIDNDEDGEFNEDGLGGINLGRNFTWGNRNREQIHCSPYAMSEPETRATMEFWMAHPNIYTMVDLHTYGGFDELLYFPGGDDMPAEDTALFDYQAAAYAQFTDREPVLPRMKAFPQPIWDLGMGDPEPFVYYYMGIFGWCEELWGADYANPFLRKYDEDQDETISEDEIIAFLDAEAGGKWFVPWTPFDHPQLGKVEIGGLVHKFSRQNPPPEFLEKELAFKMPWYLYLAELAPQVELTNVRVDQLDEDYAILEATVANQGFLPSNVTERAIQVALAKPVVVHIDLKDAELVDGKKKIVLGHIPGNRTEGGEPPANTRTAKWIIKKRSPNAEATVTVISEKAGTDSETVSLGSGVKR
jgi:hypothetical protein